MSEKTITIKVDIRKILGLYDNDVLSEEDVKNTLKEFSKEELIDALMTSEDHDLGIEDYDLENDEDEDDLEDDDDIETIEDEEEIEETHKPEPKVIDTQAKEVTEDEDDSEEDLDFLDE